VVLNSQSYLDGSSTDVLSRHADRAPGVDLRVDEDAQGEYDRIQTCLEVSVRDDITKVTKRDAWSLSDRRSCHYIVRVLLRARMFDMSRGCINGRGIVFVVVPGLLSTGQVCRIILSRGLWVVVSGGSTAAWLEQRAAPLEP